MKNHLHLTAVEFNGTTVRVGRAVHRRSRYQVTDCFSFESMNFETDASHRLRKEMRRRRIKSDQLILAVPRHCAMSRLVKFPSRQESEIRSMVSLYVRREASFHGGKKISHDYKIVGFDESGQAIVSIICVQDNHLQRYLTILEKAGFWPGRVTVNLQGLQSWAALQDLPFNQSSQKCSFLLNIDHKTYDFMILRNAQCVFSRSLIQSEGCDDDYGWLTREIKTGFEFFRRCVGEGVDYDQTLYVTGTVQDFEHQRLESALSWTVQFVDVAGMLPLKSTLASKIQGEMVSYASVLGLVTSKDLVMDVTPVDLVEKNHLWQRRKLLRRMRFWVGAFVVVVGLATARWFEVCSQEGAQLRQQARRVASVESMVQALRGYMVVKKEITRRGNAAATFSDVLRRVPPGVFISSLGLDPDRGIALKGMCPDLSSVSAFVEELEKSDNWRHVSVERVEQKAVKGLNHNIQFTIFLRLKDDSRSREKKS